MDIFDDIHGVAGRVAVSTHAGFPNPAAERDHTRPRLSLDQLLIKHPSSTYFFRLAGHELAGEGIKAGDIALVDRALTAQPTDLVITWQGDAFGLERYVALSHRAEPWGVVTAIVHTYRPTGGQHAGTN